MLPQNWFKEWRQHAHLSQEELGRRIGVSGAQISRIERGLRTVNQRFLFRFAQVVKCGHYATPLIGPPEPGGPPYAGDMMLIAKQIITETRAKIAAARAPRDPPPQGG